MADKKCSICGRKAISISWRILNRDSESPKMYAVPLCDFCSVKETYAHSKGCLETHLDYLIKRLEGRGKLDKDELDFLKAVRKEIPEMVKEFPILFEKLK